MLGLTLIEPKGANKSPLSPLYKRGELLTPLYQRGIEGDFVGSMWKDICLFYKVPMNDLCKKLCNFARALCANAFVENLKVCFARLGFNFISKDQ